MFQNSDIFRFELNKKISDDIANYFDKVILT